MKTLIKLEETSFSMKEIVNDLKMSSFCLWAGKEAKLVKTTDFGILFIGERSANEASWLSEDNPEAPIFSINEKATMGHVAKALGAFESVSQARKNGWDGEVPEGLSFHSIRIAKVKGIITIMNLK